MSVIIPLALCAAVIIISGSSLKKKRAAERARDNSQGPKGDRQS